MQPMRFFIDTHDWTRATFPAGITVNEFEDFYKSYQDACQTEGVVPIRVHVSFEDGRAFCLNMAQDANAVRRAHMRAGLSFDSITEVKMASPGDVFFRPAAN